MKIKKLLNDWILILETPEEDVTSGGIILPDNRLRDYPGIGVIRGIGMKCPSKSLKIDDMVIFNKWKGKKKMLNKQAYCFIKLENIWGIINN